MHRKYTVSEIEWQQRTAERYQGKSQASYCLVTYVAKSRRKGVRYGITTSKKIGCAVERNRAKRVIRSAFSQIEDRLNGNYDIVFIARTKTSKVKMQQVLEQMEKQFKALGVID